MRLNHLILLATIALLLAHGAGSFLNYYVLYSNFDVLAHSLGGIWVAAALISFANWYPRISFLTGNKWTDVAVVVGLTVLVGVLWEFFEFYLCLSTNSPFQTYTDTLSDLFFDMAGAFLSGFLAFFVLKRD